MNERAKTPEQRLLQPGFLGRLRKDTAGNTLMLVAGAILPLTAMIGAGVDIGRTYLVKSRLQQACDAGVLAGRKYMTGTTLSSTAESRSRAFFTNNFPTGSFGSTDISFTPSRTNDGQVTATASARVPMAVMQIFGNEQIDLSVACDARLEVANTDVMLVLDVTGSMSRCPDDSVCNSGVGSKIVGLREAVLSFYDTVSAATTTDSRFRVGFVPYSSTVNVGIDPQTNTDILPSNWLVDNWPYQSRVANMTTPGWTPTTTYSGWTNQTYGVNISNNNCTKYGNNTSFTGFNPSPSGNPTVPTNDIFQIGQPATVNQTFYQRVSATWGSGNKTCIRRYRTATTTYAMNGRYGFTNWDYKSVTYNVNDYKAGNVVNVYASNSTPTGTVNASGAYDMVALVNTAGSTVTGSSTIFEGCMEERDTVAQATFPTIPSGAWDLDVNTTPSSDATRWRPMWEELVYDRNSGGPSSSELGVTTNRSPITTACPAPASKLAVRTRTDVEDYVNTLIATGNTFHDLGMAWGVRMVSPTGMWASENTTAPNGRPISRHIIYMTDGDINTPPTTYSSHGYEKVDRRVAGAALSPTTTEMDSRHTERFIALCNAARANNIVVWTIAFGTSNPPALVSCADSGKAYVATDTATLTAQFQQIAANIAKLRLSR